MRGVATSLVMLSACHHVVACQNRTAANDHGTNRLGLSRSVIWRMMLRRESDSRPRFHRASAPHPTIRGQDEGCASL